MIGIRNLWDRFFGHEPAEPDPRLVEALDEVDAAKRRLDRTIDVAERAGVFDSLRMALVQSADTDAARIRRLRRRR